MQIPASWAANVERRRGRVALISTPAVPAWCSRNHLGCGFCDVTIADCSERIETLPPDLAEVPALHWGMIFTA